jgi:hypothetical protein
MITDEGMENRWRSSDTPRPFKRRLPTISPISPIIVEIEIGIGIERTRDGIRTRSRFP